MLKSVTFFKIDGTYEVYHASSFKAARNGFYKNRKITDSPVQFSKNGDVAAKYKFISKQIGWKKR